MNFIQLPNGLHMGVTPVTQNEYEKMTGEYPSSFKDFNKPVECVSWFDAETYCQLLSKFSGKSCRLPTEAEWEYASLAGNDRFAYWYAHGDDPKALGNYAWFDGNADNHTQQVKLKLPNAWGLYDMIGNVWEWCQDSHGSGRITKGGSWNSGHELCRPLMWNWEYPHERKAEIGFRVVFS